MPAVPGSEPRVRIGQGYDSHRLVPGDPAGSLIIGGVRFDASVRVVAHSDGDALMHAITDAILGALGLPDIGQLFPDSEPRWKGAASETFLAKAKRLAADAGWAVGNVDATVIVESPKIGSRKDEIRANLARVLGVDVARVNVKGKTHERAKGEHETCVEAIVAVLMVRSN